MSVRGNVLSRPHAVTHTTERLTPLSLAQIVTRYLAEGAPVLEVEVLED
jgi:hypothetical protein